ncbi:MAG: t-SNARE [Olpidium bornovanus]|uniref:t-SNARE n=1 Tax=Olpidium bornovanus TaxID=278681 RepID=A0A8H8DJJ8_9FUNG|nr:MAG: t-SNARE [Olpidium bornovanus]
MTDLSGFLAKIGQLNADIECLNGNISDISRYQSYTLEESQQYAQERKVKALEEETTARMNQVKNQIKAIEIENAKMPDNSPELALRRNHHGQLRKKFLEVVQQYSQLEVDHRAKIRQKMERQYRIVRPDASPEEVNEFFDRNDGGHLFAQAVSALTYGLRILHSLPSFSLFKTAEVFFSVAVSTPFATLFPSDQLINPQRYNDASRTLDEVRSRHQDMVKLESTIAELARMYEEVATLVQAQHETVVSVEKHVDTTEAHLTQATAQIDRAQDRPRRRRACDIPYGGKRLVFQQPLMYHQAASFSQGLN